MTRHRVLIAVSLPVWLALAGCGNANSSFEELSEARHLSGDLEVAFTKATGAANHAVMADTDETSARYVQEANAEKQTIRDRTGRLRTLLEKLRYSDELRTLGEFEGHFADYDKVDRQVLEFAVENTNVKAQRLSFEAGQGSADVFRDALQAIAAGRDTRETWRVKATCATALAAVREIQVLQARHIPNADDGSMTEIEDRMKAEEKTARDALAALPALVGPAAGPTVTTATAAMDRVMAVNGQIVALSRRNTNVRSLALSLNEKQRLAPPCQLSLRQLREALARHGQRQGRWGA